MNILLVIRSEIIAVFILLFFIIYNKVCSKYREGKDYFNGLAWVSLGHAVMGLITEITVNKKDFPVWANNILHIMFFAFALLFSLKYFEYVISLIIPKRRHKIFLIVSYVFSLACILVMFFAPIEYVQGNGTKYSAGLGPTLCYALGFLLMLVSDLLIIIYRKKINTQTVMLLIPLSIMTLVFMVIQIIIPEFLFTDCALSITVVGVFFAIENPVGKFQSKAFIDSHTQVWSKNSYDFDMTNTIPKQKYKNIAFVIADINGLKTVNDNMGHIEGDVMIKTCADSMIESMENAYKIYRIGGDEFVALYLDIPEKTIKKEIENITRLCREKSKDKDFLATMSIGYALGEKGDSMRELIKKADTEMYENKNEYYRKNGIDRRKT